ncbi:MAG: hypothetical protein PHX88_11350 [Methanoculleus horonobensis]|nr:hypothetical protein [Methanoculleus horonobensis]
MENMGSQRVKLSGETMERIHRLRFEMSQEMDFAYGVEDLIDTALTALEDVRSG